MKIEQLIELIGADRKIGRDEICYLCKKLSIVHKWFHKSNVSKLARDLVPHVIKQDNCHIIMRWACRHNDMEIVNAYINDSYINMFKSFMIDAALFDNVNVLQYLFKKCKRPYRLRAALSKGHMQSIVFLCNNGARFNKPMIRQHIHIIWQNPRIVPYMTRKNIDTIIKEFPDYARLLVRMKYIVLHKIYMKPIDALSDIIIGHH